MANRQRLRQGAQVTYRPTDEEAIEGGGSRGDEWAAIITKVHLDGTVNLHVLEADGETRAHFNVSRGRRGGTYDLGLPSVGNVGVNVKIPPGALVIKVSEPTYELDQGDHGKTILFTHPDGCLVTVPDDLFLGFKTALVQDSAGSVRLGALGSLTFKGPVSAPPPYETPEYGTQLVLTQVSEDPSEMLIEPTALVSRVTGWIYVEDASVPAGEPGWGASDAKVFLDPPANTVLDEIVATDNDLLVRVRASYPLVRLSAPNGNEVDAQLPRDSYGVGNLFRGDVAITIDVDGNVEARLLTPDSEPGGYDNLAVTLDLPPTVTQAKFTGVELAPHPDNYPLGPTGVRQTALKAGDTYQVEVTANKPFNQVVFEDYGASAYVERAVTPDVSGPQTSVVNILAANRGNSLQLLAARVKVKDAATGAYSETLDTNHDVDPPGSEVDGLDAVYLNNLKPSGSVTGVAFPPGQTALKGTEATPAPGVQHTAANYDEILYSDPTGDELDIPNVTVFNPNKLVTCKDPVGRFNNSNTNFRYLMTRHENGGQTTVNKVVTIANVVHQITIAKASRLRSGGNNSTAAQNHTITIQSNQPLIEAPVLDEDSGGNRGSFVEGVWGGGPSNWTRTLHVDETVPDEKGTFAFENLYSKGLSGLEQISAVGGSEAYVLGGFVVRTLVVTPFANGADIDTEVADFSKLTAVEIPELGLDMVRQPIGTPVQPDTPENETKRGWYTIDATGINPTRLLLLHQGTIDGNAAGMTITGVQETV